MGARRLSRWLRQPLMSVEDIQLRQSLLGLFVEDAALRYSFHGELLRRMPDLTRIGRKLSAGRAGLSDCVRLYEFAELLPAMRETLRAYMGPAQPLLDEHFSAHVNEIAGNLEPFQRMIAATVDFDALARHEYLIKPTFERELAELYAQREEVEAKVLALGNRFEKQLKLKSLDLKVWPGVGYAFKVSKRDEAQLRKKKVRYQVVSMKNDGVRFRTPELTPLAEQFAKLSKEYQVRQQRLIDKLLEVSAGYLPVIEAAADLITKLDVFSSLAEFFSSAPGPYVCPSVSALGEGDLHLVQARHPIIETQESVTFIPNDLLLRRDGPCFHLITGPNMGGKSTAIRTAALVVVLAQVGLYVPCTSARIPIMDAVLCRVGAGDSQLRGVSTFMAEMLETAAILRTVTANSLVIIDELGRGTATSDVRVCVRVCKHVCVCVCMCVCVCVCVCVWSMCKNM
jgi:DNA mismatch repair protein MSH2